MDAKRRDQWWAKYLQQSEGRFLNEVRNVQKEADALLHQLDFKARREDAAVVNSFVRFCNAMIREFKS
jgi:hypothetical protein